MNQINEALKHSGVRKSEVYRYKFVDEYGNRSYYKPRTKALRFEIEILFLDDAYKIVNVWVNGLNEVVIEFKYVIN